MPLTPLQTEVLHLLAANRSPDSFVAGGTVLNAGEHSPRYSKDIDVFHDIEASVAMSARADAGVLASAGFGVQWLIQQPMFQRADLIRSGETVRIEWVFDSAFRFFPAEPDPSCGWRLNLYDAATNKVLALMSRREPRDYLDTLYFHRETLSLGALCWAAAGKDPGVNPYMILEESHRSTRYQAEEFAELRLNTPIDLPGWKRTWLEAKQQAEALFNRLPAEEVGCLYLNAQDKPVTPDPASPGFPTLKRHFGTVRGAWPVIRK